MSALPYVERSRPKAARIFERDPHDWFVEPVEATAGLLRVERFVGTVWDPACGGGNILRACQAAHVPAVGTDVVNRIGADEGARFAGVHDFLSDAPIPVDARSAINIVTNPPFFRARGTEAFIRKALEVATGKVAVFTDVKFLASQRRASGLFAEHCPHRVWTLAKRPSCPPGGYLAAGNVAGGGTADWCWMVYDLTAPPVKMYQGAWILPEAGHGN